MADVDLKKSAPLNKQAIAFDRGVLEARLTEYSNGIDWCLDELREIEIRCGNTGGHDEVRPCKWCGYKY